MPLNLCSREAVQILGGIGYTRGGQGDRIERAFREVKAIAIPGGSEEVSSVLCSKISSSSTVRSDECDTDPAPSSPSPLVLAIPPSRSCWIWEFANRSR